MSHDWATLDRIHEAAFAKLRALEGRFWKRVAGEFHSQYDEMPFWILLYEDSDIAESHAALCDVLQPFMAEMGSVNFTVGYYTADTVLLHFWEFLNDNAEIVAARDGSRLRPRKDTELRERRDVFGGAVSGKRP